MISEKRINCGRIVYVKIPLFINYLFLRVPEDGQWYRARRTAGVCDFLMNHDGPAHDSIIEGLMASEKAGVVALPEAPDLAIDTPVRILKGPFAAQIGLYQGCARASAVACCSRYSDRSNGSI
jgi:hypothetical protein